MLDRREPLFFVVRQQAYAMPCRNFDQRSAAVVAGDSEPGEINRLAAGEPRLQRLRALARKIALGLVDVASGEPKPIHGSAQRKREFTQPGASRTVASIECRNRRCLSVCCAQSL